jgi:leucyl-tRNA synthetase
MLAPLAPHIAEELWWRLGHAASLAHERWPEWDDHVLADAHVEIPVQVMGRVRSHVTVAADADAPALERAALADAKVQVHVAGKAIRRVIVVPGKLVNIVTS